MQDEYVYSVAARLQGFSDQQYGNYFFSLIFSTTNLCGAGFYGCSKILNALMFAITLAFVFLIARIILNIRSAAIITLVIALSPLVIYTSFFMPDTMFYSAALGVIYLAVKLAKIKPSLYVPILGIGIGLSALIKSHALFLLPAFSVFIFFILVRNRDFGKTRAASFALLLPVTTLITKLITGFAFAGVNGLAVFGPEYDKALLGFFPQLSAFVGPQISMPLALADITQVTGTIALGESNKPLEFVASFGWQLLMHFSLLVILAIYPLANSLWQTMNVARARSNIDEKSQLALVAFFLTTSTVLLVAAFESFVTVNGDNHDFRIITRYYDYLIPLFLIVSFAFNQKAQASLKTKLLTTLLALGGIIFGIVQYPTHLSPKFSDSPSALGLLTNPAIAFLIFVISVCATLTLLISSAKYSTIVARGALTSVLLFTGQASLEKLTSSNSLPAFFDVAGIEASKELKSVSGSQIKIFGTQTITAVTPKFWIDKPGIVSEIVSKDVPVTDAMSEGFEYVLLIGELFNETSGVPILDGEGYKLIKFEN